MKGYDANKKGKNRERGGRTAEILRSVKTRIEFLVTRFNKQLFFILPSISGVILFLLLPLLDVCRRSFCQGTSNHFTGFANYKTIFQNKAFLLAVGNTLKFEAVCLPLLLILSLLTAIGVWNSKSSFLKYAMLVPMAIPSNSIAAIWRLLFDKAGIINGILTGVFHIREIDFLNSSYTFWILVFTYLWKNIGYNMLIWMAGLSAIPKNIYEAAVVDGANDIELFFKITLPNLRNVAYAVSVLAFVNSFKVYREAYLISGNYPDNHIYILQHLFNNWFQKLDVGKLAAGSCVTAFFVFLVLGALRFVILREDLEDGKQRNGMRRRKIKQEEGGKA